jgi:hypothetical protein
VNAFDEAPPFIDEVLAREVNEQLVKEALEHDLEAGRTSPGFELRRWMQPGECDPLVTAIISQGVASIRRQAPMCWVYVAMVIRYENGVLTRRPEYWVQEQSEGGE